MSDDERDALRDAMRKRFAVHYSQIGRGDATGGQKTAEGASGQEAGGPEERDATFGSTAAPANDEPDTGEPMKWE